MSSRRSTTCLFKVSIVIFGAAIFGIAFDNHYPSIWSQSSKLYKLCYDKPFLSERCPDIAIERYFVAMSFLSVVLSLLNLFAECKLDLTTWFSIFMDTGYHLLTSLLLFLASVLYIMSTVHLHDRIREDDWTNEEMAFSGFQFTQRLIIGIIAIHQSLLYAVTTMFISNRLPSLIPYMQMQ